MGCANSKERRCRHCHAPYSPVRRSSSMDIRHRLPQTEDDSYHVVALKSSTIGSLKLDPTSQNGECWDNNHKVLDGGPPAVSEDLDSSREKPSMVEKKRDKVSHGGSWNICNGDGEFQKGDVLNEFSVGLIEAKTWSNMIDEKISKVVPRTPIRTPPGEPEMINTWELMEGLDDEVSPFRSPSHVRSFSFDVIRSPPRAPFDLPKSRFQQNGSASPESIRSGSIVAEFNAGEIAVFRKSLEALSPDHPFHIHSSNSQEDASTEGENREPTDIGENGNKPDFCRKEKVIVYFTSLRGIRKTYEDGCHVRVILKGMGVRIDERDVSMHSGFKDELAELLGGGVYRGGLPRVFVGRKYIGGADEVRRMHEEGELEKVLENCEKVDEGGGYGKGGGACEACGDVRFVPCETCSGSCKVYYEGNSEGEEEEEEEGSEEGEFGFHRCPDCNENGLIRCPICCY